VLLYSVLLLSLTPGTCPEWRSRVSRLKNNGQPLKSGFNLSWCAPIPVSQYSSGHHVMCPFRWTPTACMVAHNCGTHMMIVLCYTSGTTLLSHILRHFRVTHLAMPSCVTHLISVFCYVSAVNVLLQICLYSPTIVLICLYSLTPT